MRFRAYERVVGEDAGRVLAALEASLRTELADVERRSNRITVLGLGPGPTRRVNRRDMTVIYVIDENGTAVIDADVSFQASAFLGDVSQDEMMRERLAEIFKQMRELLAATRYAAAESAEVPPEPVYSHPVYEIEEAEMPVAQEVHEPVAMPEEPPVEMTSAPADPIAAVPELVVIDDTPLPETGETIIEPPPPEAAETQAAEPEMESAVPPERTADEASLAKPAAPATVADSSTTSQKHQTMAPAKEEAVQSEPSPVLEDVAQEDFEDQEEEEESSSQRWWIVLAVLTACLAAALPFGTHYLSSLHSGTQAQPASASSPPPAQQPTTAEKPEDLLRQWEESMRTTDADTQASYYTDPSEHYMWRANATRAQIVADKKAEIANRRGEWTFAIEQMQVDQQNDAATVNLVKHYTEKEAGRPQRQWYVPSELKLKYQYGIWWITAERDLGQTGSSGTP